MNALLKTCRLAWFLLMGSLTAPFTASGQEVIVQGGFLVDSVKIGEEVPFYLSARYASSLTVLFPDSTASFEPFEYVRKQYFPTRTIGGISFDSAIYYLTTFEIDRIQSLELPAYLIHGNDSVMFASPRDTVLITQLVARVPDTVAIQELPLREDTNYRDVDYAFNAWMAVIIAAVILVIVVTLWLVFGTKLTRWFAIRRLRKRHLSFLEKYNQLLAQLNASFSVPATESALSTWKSYLEQLESRPFTKLTTRETSAFLAEPGISDHLSQVDRAIYGHPTGVVASLEQLRRYAEKRYEHKVKEVKHG